MTRNKGIEWASGHGGGHEKPAAPPEVPAEVIAARAKLRRAEAEYHAAAAELREAIARAGGGRK
jgi:hypothetical protein